MRRFLLLAGATALGLVSAIPGASAAGAPARSESGVPVTYPRAHVIFDDTHQAPRPGVTLGAKAEPLLHPKIALRRTSTGGPLAATTSTSSTKPDPEVLGFAQAGEVSSGAWSSDIHFDLISTIAYFGINTYGSGALVTNDYGYQTYWSNAATNLINTAHSNGDRVVLTVKAMDDTTIATVTGNETNRQTFIANVIQQVSSRGTDGVNIDFEGNQSSVAPYFTTLIHELRSAMLAQIPAASYLTVDTYGSAAAGGTMYDIPGLAPNVDAFMVMAYDMNSWSNASPTAPLNGYGYNDNLVVSQYLSVIPASQMILGVPYYGYKWSTSSNAPNAATISNAEADTYSGMLADKQCATGPPDNWTQSWDQTGAVPWAYWWSPSTGDPCGGNHGAWRELYFDNATSLGYKYDLVNNSHLRGIGIWALGYDGGTSDLWNEINLKFSVTHGPAATMTALPSTESSTSFQVCWTIQGSATHTILWVEDGSGGWEEWTDTTSTCSTAFGFAGHSYTFWAQPFDAGGWAPSGPDGTDESSTTVSSSAPKTTPFKGMYAVDGYGLLHAVSSPPLLDPAAWRGWNIARGVALDGDALGGQVMDGYGGLHPFGDAATLSGGPYWPGWDIARDIVIRGDSLGGYILDGFGGVHPIGNAPAVQTTGYWPGWDIARRLVLRPDGVSGYVLDGFGGLHPFAAAGVAMPPVPSTAYWPYWDIARSVVLLSDGVSGYTLDGYGGIHPFGNAPAVSCGCYWPYWDVARSLVLINGTSEGYLVDGVGGVHPFGGAPAVTSVFTTGLINVRSAGLS